MCKDITFSRDSKAGTEYWC